MVLDLAWSNALPEMVQGVTDDHDVYSSRLPTMTHDVAVRKSVTSNVLRHRRRPLY